MRGQDGYDYVTSGGGKKPNRPNSKKKVAARQEARKASGMSAQKFYVKTRMAEAAKSGKKLDRAALRKKFQSGDVARKGFGAPKKKTGQTGTAFRFKGNWFKFKGNWFRFKGNWFNNSGTARQSSSW
jgi:hypothetical protein